MDLGIEGHVAIITGGGGEIGAAACTAFAKEGCKVAVLDIDGSKAERVAQLVRDQGGSALAIATSVANSSQVDAAVTQIARAWGSIHILVNNAGGNDDAPLTEMTDLQWHNIVDANLTGAFYCSRASASWMIKQRYGRIINVSSRTHLGEINKANYCASKAGLLGLSRALAAELGPYEITVNSLTPGMVRTARVLNTPDYQGLSERARQRQLIKREGRVEDVVNAMLFYASATSGFVSGDMTYVSGGRLT